MANGGQGGDYAGVVSDSTVVIQGHIEVNPAKYAFTAQIQVSNGTFVEHRINYSI
jgi:hypothetical protein